MLACFTDNQTETAIPLIPITANDFSSWLENQETQIQNWLSVNNFKAKPGSFCMLPNSEGTCTQVLIGVENTEDTASFAGLSTQLPAQIYVLDDIIPAQQQAAIAINWGLNAYRFERYKKNDKPFAQLKLQNQLVKDTVKATYLTRDLINTPTEDMGPAQLAQVAEELGKEFNAEVEITIGEQLLQDNFPAIYTVGRASSFAPRLIDLRWGDKNHPKVTLVGKGVCFDSGGLDIKPASGMRIMKKDMGGSAHVLGLAQLIMAQNLPIQLRVLIPAVENAISSNAYRPGDVVATRSKKTIEVGNTDAEGRVVLADAITYACEDNPELILDFATLTGAARIAMGTDVGAMFSNNDELANALTQHSNEANDPLWRMPLYKPYRKLNESSIADITNSGPSVYGGAITAALFLEAFIENDIPWAHFDIMAWNLSTRPGKPEGGEAVGLRTVFNYLQDHFA